VSFNLKTEPNRKAMDLHFVNHIQTAILRHMWTV